MTDHHDHDHDHDLAELLDLDEEVLRDHHRDVMTWVAAQLPAAPQIIDLGAGTGAGALALAALLPGAHVTAVDVAQPMLDHLAAKARARGLVGQVTTVRADLDEPWPPLAPADLVWAANSMHHVTDPATALARAAGVLRPGGLLAVSEVDAFPRFLADEAGAALEERSHAVLSASRVEAGLHMAADWAALLAGAGLSIAAERRFDIALAPPLPAAAGRYAQVTLARIRRGADGRLSPADLAALDAAAAAAPGRDDLIVRASSAVWLARSPVHPENCDQ